MTDRTRRARSRGFGISYEDGGDGFPIVLINGLGGRAGEWRDLGFVDRLVPPYRVLSIDPLGHGASDTPHDWQSYRAPAVAEDIVAAMDDAGVERAAMWGYSRGAWLAAIIAAEHPERVAALIAGGADLTAPTDPTIPPWTEAMIRADWEAIFEALGPLSERDREEVRRSDPQAVAAADVGSRHSDYVLDVRRIAAPTLLYCGGGDEPEGLEPTAKALSVPVAVIGAGDHFAAFAEVDAIVPIVLAHLEAVGTVG